MLAKIPGVALPSSMVLVDLLTPPTLLLDGTNSPINLVDARSVVVVVDVDCEAGSVVVMSVNGVVTVTSSDGPVLPLSTIT